MTGWLLYYTNYSSVSRVQAARIVSRLRNGKSSRSPHQRTQPLIKAPNETCVLGGAPDASDPGVKLVVLQCQRGFSVCAGLREYLRFSAVMMSCASAGAEITRSVHLEEQRRLPDSSPLLFGAESLLTSVNQICASGLQNRPISQQAVRPRPSHRPAQAATPLRSPLGWSAGTPGRQPGAPGSK